MACSNMALKGTCRFVAVLQPRSRVGDASRPILELNRTGF